MSAAVRRRLWVTSGWLSIGFVVLVFVGSALSTDLMTVGDKPSHVAAGLVTSSMTRNYAVDDIWLLATLAFMAGGLLLARMLRGEGEVAGWLSSCMAGAAVAYVAVSIAVGAAGAAALYAGHHGAPLATVTALNDVSSFGFPLSAAVGGVFVLAASGAGQATRLLPRWFCITGYVVGVVCIAAVPAVRAGSPQTPLWYVWMLLLGVIALQRARRTSVVTASVAAGAPA